MVPEIITPRLKMRMIVVEDAPFFFELNNDLEVLKYTGDIPFGSLEEAQAFIANYDQYHKYQVGRLAVELRETGALLGWVGLKYHPENGEVDLGYRLARRYWNQGYATEAGQAAMADGVGRLHLNRFVAHVHPQNTASIVVTERLGFQYLNDYPWEGEKWLKFERCL